MKPNIARYEWFTDCASGERRVARFWIAGPLKALEKRARRENDPEGQKPSGFDVILALAIAIGATLAVLTML